MVKNFTKFSVCFYISKAVVFVTYFQKINIEKPCNSCKYIYSLIILVLLFAILIVKELSQKRTQIFVSLQNRNLPLFLCLWLCMMDAVL